MEQLKKRLNQLLNEAIELDRHLLAALPKSILQEAIQGKLLPQNPNDEPASILLERIREEKQRLFKEGKLKKKDITDSIIFKGDDNKYYEKIGNETVCIDEEISFSIPNSWEWVRIGVLAKLISGTSYQKGDIQSQGIRILRGGNIQNDKLVLYDDVYLSEQMIAPLPPLSEQQRICAKIHDTFEFLR